jgi:hypothetical protein
MQHMKTSQKIGLSAALTVALGIGGCFGGGDDDKDDAVTGNDATVPDSAAASASAFVAYLLALGQSDETSEPSAIGSSFEVPPEEAADPQPLS